MKNPVGIVSTETRTEVATHFRELEVNSESFKKSHKFSYH